MTLEQKFLESLQRYFREERNTAHLVLHQLHNLGKPLLLRGEVQDAFAHLRASGNADDLAGTPVEQMLQVWSLRNSSLWEYSLLEVDTSALPLS